MVFLCTHPAINQGLNTPLMLQAVLSLTAARIASAFLVRPSTMGQRLSRAKANIKQANIKLELRDRMRMPSRLNTVLEAICAANGMRMGLSARL
jgi:RNA polymerase sigma-70 factor (ECF subfamily)